LKKNFFPFGSDKEVHSDFQLIAGTHRDMRQWVAEGRFREDLYARINMWSFALPGLAQRREDIAPNVEYELQRFSRESQTQIRFDKDARERYLAFACSAGAMARQLSRTEFLRRAYGDAGRTGAYYSGCCWRRFPLQTDWQTDVTSA
jgi:transcriptional regulatory protein RtcR